jgi:type II secretion system protein I
MRLSDDDGFTLIEVLVALAIFALSSSLLLGIFGESLERERRSEHEAAARTIAQSLLAANETNFSLGAGSRAGTTASGFTYVISAVPIGPDYGPNNLGPAVLSVSVSWSDDGVSRKIVLDTLRIYRPVSTQ